jgi:hypothetical protein
MCSQLSAGPVPVISTFGFAMIEFDGVKEVYSESGVDLTLLRENLRHSFEERWDQNRQALQFCRALEESASPHDAPAAMTERRNEGTYLRLLQWLTYGQAEYALVGGLATRAYGRVDTITLLEICYRPTRKNAQRLFRALGSLQPRLRGSGVGLSCFHAGKNLALTTKAGPVNLLPSVPGVGAFSQVLAQSALRIVVGLPVWILTLDGMIAAKETSVTLKDQYCLQQLLELKNVPEADVPIRMTP